MKLVEINIWSSKSGPVGQSDSCIIFTHFKCFFQPLKDENIAFVGHPENLVDNIWTDRPSEPKVTVTVQEFKYTGFQFESFSDTESFIPQSSLYIYRPFTQSCVLVINCR